MYDVHGMNVAHDNPACTAPTDVARRFSLSQKFGVHTMKWTICLSVAALSLVGTAFVYPHHDVTFAHLRDAKARLTAAGFYCTADNAPGHISNGFTISREAITWTEAGLLCKAGPMGPHWKGKVWVTINTAGWGLETMPDDAGTRVWGAVVAFGDEELLGEIDELLSETTLGIL